MILVASFVLTAADLLKINLFVFGWAGHSQQHLIRWILFPVNVQFHKMFAHFAQQHICDKFPTLLFISRAQFFEAIELFGKHFTLNSGWDLRLHSFNSLEMFQIGTEPHKIKRKINNVKTFFFYKNGVFYGNYSTNNFTLEKFFKENLRIYILFFLKFNPSSVVASKVWFYPNYVTTTKKYTQKMLRKLIFQSCCD